MRIRLCLFALLSLSTLIFAEFENIRLTNTVYYNGEPSLFVLGDTVAVAYESYEFGNDEIMLLRSLNGGENFSAPIRITTTDSASWRPKVFVNDGCDIIYEDKLTGAREVFYRRYDASGLGLQIKISSGSVYSAFPALTGHGRDLYVVWEDGRNGNDEIYFRKYEGSAWSAEKRLTTNDSTSWGADIAFDESNSRLHVVFFDYRTGNDEVYYMTSSDNGENFSSALNLSNDAANSWEPRVAAAGGKVAVVWYGWRPDLTAYEVYCVRKTGGSFSVPQVVSLLGADSKCPAVSVSDSGIVVSWEDYGDGNDEIYIAFQRWAENEWKITRVTSEGHDSFGSDVMLAGSFAHVVWFDYRDGVDQIYFASGNWQTISTEKVVSLVSPLIRLFPNPIASTSQLLVGLPDGNAILEWMLCDPLGRVVNRSVELNSLNKPASHFRVDLAGCPPGCYFLKGSLRDHTRFSRPITIK
ncbi:MAG: hypothetical protein A2293_15225 [Elusimicrobia bacterium RIFOXYB2_FULL_49_7]|nr:MAG: hypothetical protein A2293_15225 [Elusimicrobia bacterium RIFOXYB2_FULL_49_7]